MTTLHVQLFGRFGFTYGECGQTGLEARKAQELLAYLLLFRNRPHTRESLIDVLWENTQTAQAKKYLRQSLWQLQTALPDDAEPILMVEADWIQINPEASIDLDVAELEIAYGQVQGISGRDLVPEQGLCLHQATRRYQNDLLQGWYQDWCIFERERLQLMYLAMLEKLLSYCEATHRYDAGLVYGMDILRCDRTRERAHRRLMRLHYLAGDRSAAIRQYQHCVTSLAEELDVKPSRKTVALYNEIRADRISDLSEDDPLVELPLPHSTLQDILNRLIQLQSSVADIQSSLSGHP